MVRLLHQDKRSVGEWSVETTSSSSAGLRRAGRGSSCSPRTPTVTCSGKRWAGGQLSTLESQAIF